MPKAIVSIARSARGHPSGAKLQLLYSRRPGTRSWVRAAIAESFLAFIILSQFLSGTYRSEFAGYPDEGAHYVTGLMVHDYIVAGRLAPLEQFAKSYYLHYPKVSIGHWPPFFYLVQAAWTLMLPASRASLLVLMAFITTVVAFALYRAVASEMGEFAGIAAGLFFIGLPVTQESSGMLMADALVALLALLAVLRFARFMDQGRPLDALLFGLFSAMTILTKGTGLALAGVPLIAIALTNRWKLLLRPAFWLPVAVVVPLCAPWYWITRHMLQSTGEHPTSAFSYIETAVRFYVAHSFRILGAALFGLALLGFIVQVILKRRREVGAKWAVLAALVISIGFLSCVVPVLPIGGQRQVMGTEERFLFPAIPAIIAFGFAGMEYIVGRLVSNRLNANAGRIVLALIIAATLVPKVFSRKAPISFGFSPVAKNLIAQPELKKAVVLISSDAIGEGMFISQVAMAEKRPGHYLVRASKVLCDCSWSGEEHTPLYPNPAALMGYFDRSPIQVVVDDESAPARSSFEFHHILRKTIQQYPSRWQLIGTFPVSRDGVVHPAAIKVYKVFGTNPRASLEVNMRRMLNTTMELKPE
jgi:hypothetical protein